ncbi:hypothetical protein PYCC9005_005470 [Savitreella phatthalungensis]
MISLKTRCEVICLFAVLNKASGIYGVLALLTGAHVSAWQMSMYVYSIAATALFLVCMRHIASSSPREFRAGTDSLLGVVVFAWAYLADSLINGVYTAVFATSWFMVLASGSAIPGAGMLDKNAGFNTPAHPVESVAVTSTPVVGGVVAELHGQGKSDGVVAGAQLPSIIALALILILKLYFCLVAFQYARLCIHHADKRPYPGVTIRSRAYALLTTFLRQDTRSKTRE